MKTLMLSLSILLFLSCDQRAIYSESVDLPEGGWKYENPLNFSFDVKSSDTFHDLFLSLTYGQDFRYQNIYVKIKTDYPSSESVEDIVSLNMTDGAGTFLGDCSSYKCTIDILLQEKFKFKEEGKHTIRIYQHSRESELKAVYSADLKLFAAEAKQ